MKVETQLEAAASVGAVVIPEALPEPPAGGRALLTRDLSLLRDVSVQLQVHVGNATVSMQRLFELQEGHVVEMEQSVQEPVSIVLNGKTIARGELVACGDQLGVRITEVLVADVRPA